MPPISRLRFHRRLRVDIRIAKAKPGRRKHLPILARLRSKLRLLPRQLRKVALLELLPLRQALGSGMLIQHRTRLAPEPVLRLSVVSEPILGKEVADFLLLDLGRRRRVVQRLAAEGFLDPARVPWGSVAAAAAAAGWWWLLLQVGEVGFDAERTAAAAAAVVGVVPRTTTQ